MMGTTQYDSAMFDIETHWTSVVGTPPSELSKKQKDQQEAIWELLHTEVQYIRKLQVVIDVSVHLCSFFKIFSGLLLIAKKVWKGGGGVLPFGCTVYMYGFLYMI